MTWHVYNAFLPNAYIRGKGELQGPMPCKRWVPVKGERYKVKHKVTNGSAKVGSAQEYTEQRACLYAEWLAQRDGLTIPEGCKAVPVWDFFYSATKTDKRGNEAMVRRVRAVHWRKSNGHHANGREAQATLLIVDIPHWDWEPSEPVYSEDLFAEAA
jgi:hypothetical protein